MSIFPRYISVIGALHLRYTNYEKSIMYMFSGNLLFSLFFLWRIVPGTEFKQNAATLFVILR